MTFSCTASASHTVTRPVSVLLTTYPPSCETPMSRIYPSMCIAAPISRPSFPRQHRTFPSRTPLTISFPFGRKATEYMIPSFLSRLFPPSFVDINGRGRILFDWLCAYSRYFEKHIRPGNHKRRKHTLWLKLKLTCCTSAQFRPLHAFLLVDTYEF